MIGHPEVLLSIRPTQLRIASGIEGVRMTWSDFYLICFIVGCTLSVLSFLGGAFHLHLPGAPGHHLHFWGHHHFTHHGSTGGQISPFNLPTIMAFLAWFGGAGYLASTLYGLGILIVLGIACISGFTGARIAFWFLANVLMRRDHTMRKSDYFVAGRLATVNSPIREGRTGEIVYSQGGKRKATAARSQDGESIEQGEEVVIVRYENGIAYVCRLSGTDPGKV